MKDIPREVFRMYKNAFEICKVTKITDTEIEGWSDLVRIDTDTFDLLAPMALNKENSEGKKLAVLLCKHKKESVRWFAEKILRGDDFVVEDRSTITL